MKHVRWLTFLLIFPFAIVGCVPSNKPTFIEKSVSSYQNSTQTQKITSTAIKIFTTSPIRTQTITPVMTLRPDEAANSIKTLIQTSTDCMAPCFWGITPGQTTIVDAINIFTYLGLKVWKIKKTIRDYYTINYDVLNGPTFMVSLTVTNNQIDNIILDITPEKKIVGLPRQWSAYSPETLIKRYGPPAAVEFSLGRATPIYSMSMYFDNKDLIIEYGGYYNLSDGQKLKVCPNIDQYYSVRAWFGNNLENPPLHVISLDQATDLTLGKFSQLMTTDSSDSCFNLYEKAFP